MGLSNAAAAAHAAKKDFFGVTREPLDDEILRQATAIRIARTDGHITRITNKSNARDKARHLRKRQAVATSGRLIQHAKEKLGRNG